MSVPILPEANFVAHDDGYASAYFVAGPRDGTPIMLVHGLAANGLQFVNDAHHFAGIGYRVIVPDLRGHGRSTEPENLTLTDFHREKLLCDLIAILDAEDIASVNWVGNSLGGIIAMEAMRSHANRLDKVLMFGTAFSLNIPELAIKVMAASYRTIGTEIGAVLGTPLTSNYPDAQKIVKEMLKSVRPEPVLHTGANVARYNLLLAAKAFGKPLHMIIGSRDIQVNLANRQYMGEARSWPLFSEVELKGAGHCANIDLPDAWRSEVESFLQSSA